MRQLHTICVRIFDFKTGAALLLSVALARSFFHIANTHTHIRTRAVFTHRDHIGCHAEWHAAFPGARRVLHEADMVMVNDGHGDTSGFEVVLSGPQETWTLPGCVFCVICVGVGV